jgi:hypothetical protein
MAIGTYPAVASSCNGLEQGCHSIRYGGVERTKRGIEGPDGNQKRNDSSRVPPFAYGILVKRA